MHQTLAIPSIDLAHSWQPGSPHRREVAMGLAQACESGGLFHLINPGLQDELVRRQWLLARQALQQQAQGGSVDLRCRIATGPGRCRITAVQPAQAPWSMLGWQSEPFIQAMCSLAQRLMQLVALGLEQEPRYFEDAGHPAEAELRLLRVVPGAPVAADAEQALSLCLQDEQGGLQVHTADGRWRAVAPRPGALVVGMGMGAGCRLMDGKPMGGAAGHWRAPRLRWAAEGGRSGPRYALSFAWLSTAAQAA